MPRDASDATDTFDADAFLDAVARLAAPTEERHATKQVPLQVVFAGDSTARQQAVSLCCLLQAAASATARFSLRFTQAKPYMTISCLAESRTPRPAVVVTFTRVGAAGDLKAWRPSPFTPRLEPLMYSVIRQARAVGL